MKRLTVTINFFLPDMSDEDAAIAWSNMSIHAKLNGESVEMHVIDCDISDIPNED